MKVVAQGIVVGALVRSKIDAEDLVEVAKTFESLAHLARAAKRVGLTREKFDVAFASGYDNANS